MVLPDDSPPPPATSAPVVRQGVQTDVILLPGRAHPHHPQPPDVLAEHLGVPAERMARWLDLGLPVATDGSIDPFVAVNWLADGRLGQCPALARRWALWFAWFEVAVRGRDRPGMVSITRRHSLHVDAAAPVRWRLPLLVSRPGQSVIAAEVWDLPPVDCGPSWVEVGRPMARASARVGLRPSPPVDRPDLLAQVVDVAGTFAYEYRHHRPGEPLQESRGSCLDCAHALGRRFQSQGRPWRLAGGVIAREAIANPHAWIEVEDVDGSWLPLDPSLPAIARRFGRPDWREWARYAVGSRDTRRVELGPGSAAGFAVPGGLTLDGLAGEAVIQVDGVWRNAWACIDWVCGECSWGFSQVG